MPIPGTEIAEKLEQEGRLDYDDSAFLSMLLSNDIWRSKSWNPDFSDRTLAWLRFLSHVWFFGLGGKGVQDERVEPRLLSRDGAELV